MGYSTVQLPRRRPTANWLFMLGLPSIRSALVLGVALRVAPAASTGLQSMMWLAGWQLAVGLDRRRQAHRIDQPSDR